MLLQWCLTPEQRLYEGIRPIILFGMPPAEQAQQIGLAESTLRRAKQLLGICDALDIQKEYIHPRQGWENLVETHFNVMKCMSQVHFEQVTSWEGAKLAQERFVTDYNAQPIGLIANVNITA